MKYSQLILGAGVVASMTSASAVSFAQSGGNMSTGTPVQQTSVQVGNGTTPGALPASRSDNDPAPPVAAPITAAGGVVSQAGIGGFNSHGDHVADSDGRRYPSVPAAAKQTSAGRIAETT